MNSRARFAEAVRSTPVDIGLACALIEAEVDPSLDVSVPLATLDRLAAAVRLGGPPDEALRRVLGHFQGDATDYEDLRSSLLPSVLRRQRGLPILLSVVWTEVALRLGVPAVCLGLPGHVLVCIGEPLGEHVVVDPFHGGVRRSVPPSPVLEGSDLLLRVLTNIRALTARKERSLEAVRTRLWAVELSLLLPHHPLALRREHGELLVRLGQHVRGAEELESYADVVPDPGEAQSALKSARLARSRLN